MVPRKISTRESDTAEIEWKILDSIENSDKTTQRKLSQNLGLALGAVNFHLKRLVRKGYIKMKTLPPNRAIYFVTPGGLKRKVRLTYEYMSGTLAFYRSARERSQALFDEMAQQGVRTVAFLGARDLAEICFLSVQESQLELVGIFDDSRLGETFLGLQVQPETELENCPAEKVVFTKQDWGKRLDYSGDERIIFVF